MSNHTRGPWTECCSVIRSENGLSVAIIQGGLFGSGEPEANARLVEAAPDLLKALKSCNEYLVKAEGMGEGGQSDFDVLAENVRSAIAKAEGRAV
jgi:hypothetical protein